MTDIWDIVHDVEKEYNVDLSDDEWPNLFCDSDKCGHSECECRDDFRSQLEEIARWKTGQ